MHACSVALSLVRLFATPWTVAFQAPRSIGFSSQEYWRGLPSPPPGDLPNLGVEPVSPVLQHWQVASLPLGHQLPLHNMEKLKTWCWVKEPLAKDHITYDSIYMPCPGQENAEKLYWWLPKAGWMMDKETGFFLGWWKCSGVDCVDGFTIPWLY